MIERNGTIFSMGETCGGIVAMICWTSITMLVDKYSEKELTIRRKNDRGRRILPTHSGGK